MSVESTLITVLSAGSITCYPLEKPQKVSTPVAVYKRLSTLPTKAHNATTDLNRVRISLTFWGSEYQATKDKALSAKTLLENNANFLSSQFIEQVEFKNIEENLYQIYQEYFIWSNFD